jgi:hypothetical protein
MSILGSAIPLPTATELAWLSGFIDGEGSLGLHVNSKTRTIQPRLSVPNSNRRSIERVEILLRAIIGRELNIATCKGESRRGFRPYFLVALSDHADLEMVIRAIYPYVVGKQRHVDLMLEYLKIAPTSRRNAEVVSRLYGRPRKFADATYDERHYDLVARMRRLNRRYSKGEWAAEHVEPEPVPQPISERPGAPFIGDSDDALKELFKRRIG